MSKTKTIPPGTDPVLGDLGRNWAWMLALGVFFLLLGAAGLTMLFGLTVFSILFIGVLMLAGGIAQLIETIKCTGWSGTLWHSTIAALYIICGLAVIYDPELLSKLISMAVGGVLVAVGLVRMLMAWQLRTRGEGWIGMMLTALISVTLGAMILAKWPLSGLFVIALFLAIELLLQGFSYVMLALTARRKALSVKA